MPMFHLQKTGFQTLKCKIGRIKTFLLQSQLRWAGHVIRMSGDRIANIFMYGQLEVGKCNVRRLWLRYKDKLKSNLKSFEIPLNSFENKTKDHKD